MHHRYNETIHQAPNRNQVLYIKYSMINTFQTTLKAYSICINEYQEEGGQYGYSGHTPPIQNWSPSQKTATQGKHVWFIKCCGIFVLPWKNLLIQNYICPSLITPLSTYSRPTSLPGSCTCSPCLIQLPAAWLFDSQHTTASPFHGVLATSRNSFSRIIPTTKWLNRIPQFLTVITVGSSKDTREIMGRLNQSTRFLRKRRLLPLLQLWYIKHATSKFSFAAVSLIDTLLISVLGGGGSIGGCMGGGLLGCGRERRGGEFLSVGIRPLVFYSGSLCPMHPPIVNNEFRQLS